MHQLMTANQLGKKPLFLHSGIISCRKNPHIDEQVNKTFTKQTNELYMESGTACKKEMLA